MSVVEAPARVEPRRRPAPAPAVEQAPERHLRVVGKPTRRPSRRRLLTTFALFIGFVALLAAVAAHVVLLQGQQHLDHLNERNATVQQRYNQLRLEVDRLEAPERIVAEATRQGMVQPTDQIWLAPVQPLDDPGATNDDPTAEDQAQVKPYLGTAR